MLSELALRSVADDTDLALEITTTTTTTISFICMTITVYYSMHELFIANN